jgi:hypothetical protein
MSFYKPKSSLNEAQWAEAVNAYRTESKPGGLPISTQDLAARYKCHSTTIRTGLLARGVTMRPAINPNTKTARRGNTPPHSPAPSLLTSELRAESQILALVGLLERRGGRIYLHEIQSAFGCSPFDSAVIARAVKDRTAALFDFEPCADACGMRLFLEKPAVQAIIHAPVAVAQSPFANHAGQHGGVSSGQASVTGG